MTRNAYILLLLTTLFWGANAVAAKLAVGHVSPFLLTMARWAVAMAVLAPFGWRRLKADWPAIRPHLGLLCLLGAVGFSGFNLAMFSAVKFTSAINVSIEQGAIAVLIFLFNFLFFRHRAGPWQLVGLALSIFGIALTASHGEPSRLFGLDVNFGDLLMLAAAALYAFYTLLLRFKPAIHWQSLILVLLPPAFLTAVPFVAYEYATGTMILPDMRGWGVILFAAILPTALAQAFYIRGVEIIGANRAGLFVNLVPIFGTLLSILILGEPFFLFHALALVLVLGGIWLSETGTRRLASA